MELNTFSAKKLGEVLAFALVGQETWEKGSAALEPLFPGKVGEIMKEHLDQSTAIRSLAEEAKIWDQTAAKAKATGAKLQTMRDGYIGDSWDDAAELLEWLGFFEGAAFMHWKLVEGIADSIGHDDLPELVGRSVIFHHDLLLECAEVIKEVGGERSKIEGENDSLR